MAAALLLRSLARKMARAPPAHHHPVPARGLHAGARSGPGASTVTQPPTRYEQGRVDVGQFGVGAAAAGLRSLATSAPPPPHHHLVHERGLHSLNSPNSGASGSTSTPPTSKIVLGYEPRSHLSGPQVLPRWFSSVASNGSPMQSQISETNKSGAELKQSDAQKSSEGVAPKVMAFSPLEAATAKPRSSPLTSESTKVRRSEILTEVTFYMIPATLLVSRNSISTSLLVGAVFHQVYMFHKEILLDYVHHDITRKWSLIYFKLLVLVMAKDTIMYFNMFPFY